MGQHRPHRRMAVLPAVLAQTRRIALDTAGVQGRAVKRRGEQQRKPPNRPARAGSLPPIAVQSGPSSLSGTPAMARRLGGKARPVPIECASRAECSARPGGLRRPVPSPVCCGLCCGHRLSDPARSWQHPGRSRAINARGNCLKQGVGPGPESVLFIGVRSTRPFPHVPRAAPRPLSRP
jgi:hypothetical protein